MANRNRLLYQSNAIFCGPSPSSGFHFMSSGSFAAQAVSINNDTPFTGDANSGINTLMQLYRVQTFSHDFSIPRQKIYEIGEIGSISQEILENPTVTASIEYYLTDFVNERNLGFFLGGVPNSFNYNAGCLGFMADTVNTAGSNLGGYNQSERNYFIVTLPEYVDANDSTSANVQNISGYVTSLGNSFLSQYSASASVGDFPKASISLEALNFKIDPITWAPQTYPATGDNGPINRNYIIPAVDPANGNASTRQYTIPMPKTSPTGSPSANMPSILRPGDIRFNFGNYTNELGASINDAKIQSFSLTIPITRTALQKLGSKYAFSREINFPIEGSFSMTANVGDLNSGNLTEVIKNNAQYNMSVAVLAPNTSTQNICYVISGAYLDSQSFSQNIGAGQTVTLNFSCPFAQNASIFMSGSSFSLGR